MSRTREILVATLWIIIVTAALVLTGCTPHVETAVKHCRYPRTEQQIAMDDDSNDHDYWTDEKCLPGWEVKDAK